LPNFGLLLKVSSRDDRSHLVVISGFHSSSGRSLAHLFTIIIAWGKAG